MSDITTVWNTALSYGDWLLNGADLQGGNDLTTAIYISVFTDRLAEPSDEIPDGTNNPRGWVGDLGAQYPIGSRIWLLMRAKQTQDTLNRAHDYLVEALQWLLDDGVVASFDITTEYPGPGFLAASIVAHKPNGTKLTAFATWPWTGVS